MCQPMCKLCGNDVQSLHITYHIVCVLLIYQWITAEFWCSLLSFLSQCANYVYSITRISYLNLLVFLRSVVGGHLFSGVNIPPETGGMILALVFFSGLCAKYVEINFKFWMVLRRSSIKLVEMDRWVLSREIPLKPLQTFRWFYGVFDGSDIRKSTVFTLRSSKGVFQTTQRAF